MPRGHKGSPQDSIESILLALSRRDSINPETLLHYYARLDEEWTQGAREKVLRLLASSDSSAQNAALYILARLATEDDLDDLEEFIADPTVSDLPKLSLAPILKELESEMVEDGFLEYLNDPENAMQQLQLRLLDVVDRGEMGVEVILQDILSTPIEQRLVFIQWLGESNDPRAAKILLPLIEGQSGKVALAAIKSLEQLGSLVSPQTIPALDAIMRATTNRQLKQSVRAALGRLTMQSVLGTADTAAEALQLLPSYEARVSFIDGSGSQLLLLSWKRPDGLLKIVNVWLSDLEGIRACSGMAEMDVESWHELTKLLNQQSVGCFLLPFSYSLKLIAEAYITTKRTRHKLPISYFAWRSTFESTTHAEQAAAAIVVTALPPLPFSEELHTLALRGEEIYGLDEFASWLFQPPWIVAPYLTRLWGKNAKNTGTQAKNGKAGKKAKGPSAQLNAIIDEAVSTVIDEQWRLLYEKRLRRQALLFQYTQRDQDARLVLAVAAMLHPDSGVPLREQPFVRFMMRLSLSQGPLPALVQVIAETNIDRATPVVLEPADEP